jgi:hypothetical protein
MTDQLDPADDDLLRRLAAIDPAPAYVPVHTADSPAARSLKEQIMSTPVNSSDLDLLRTAASRPRRRFGAIAAGVVGALGIGGAALLIGNGGGSPAAEADPTQAPAGPPIELSYSFDPLMSSCPMVSELILNPDGIALQGTVAGVDGTLITLTVDRWFSAGDAAEVIVDTGSPDAAALTGAVFEQGGTVLLAATDGMVDGCATGPVSPELQAAYDAAFPS